MTLIFSIWNIGGLWEIWKSWQVWMYGRVDRSECMEELTGLNVWKSWQVWMYGRIDRSKCMEELTGLNVWKNWQVQMYGRIDRSECMKEATGLPMRVTETYPTICKVVYVDLWPPGWMISSAIYTLCCVSTRYSLLLLWLSLLFRSKP